MFNELQQYLQQAEDRPVVITVKVTDNGSCLAVGVIVKELAGEVSSSDLQVKKTIADIGPSAFEESVTLESVEFFANFENMLSSIASNFSLENIAFIVETQKYKKLQELGVKVKGVDAPQGYLDLPGENIRDMDSEFYDYLDFLFVEEGDSQLMINTFCLVEMTQILSGIWDMLKQVKET